MHPQFLVQDKAQQPALANMVTSKSQRDPSQMYKENVHCCRLFFFSFHIWCCWKILIQYLPIPTIRVSDHINVHRCFPQSKRITIMVLIRVVTLPIQFSRLTSKTISIMIRYRRWILCNSQRVVVKIRQYQDDADQFVFPKYL